jgi:F-type H+-transporting ATPase subunit b
MMDLFLTALSASADVAAAAVEHGAAHGAAGAHGGAHSSPAWLGLDAKGWVAIGAILFFAILIFKFKVPELITKALDGRIAKIQGQLDEASKLRSEAEQMKRDYEARQAQAEADAKAIIAQAKEEANNLIADAKQKADDLAQRRIQAAGEKLAAAERTALAQIRQAAADASTAAARKLIAEKLSVADRDRLVDAAIADLDKRVH